MSMINVLYPFDNNYAPYAGISLTSLLHNNQNAEAIHVYVLGFGLLEETTDKFQRTVAKYHRDLTFLDPGPMDDLIRSFDMPSYRGASVAVARLFVTHFMPPDVERLIYLDSDTIVVGDLTGLINEELSGKPAGMVCDSVARDYKQFVGFASDEDYYNGGMILYDLPKWRALQCSERITEHIQSVRNNYEALDQDLINIVLKGEIKRLPLKYNYQPFHRVYTPEIYLKTYGTLGYYGIEEIREAAEQAVVLHTFRYLGMFPWHADTIHPDAVEYERYKQTSEWSNLLPEAQCEPGLVIQIERLLCRIMPQSTFLKLFRTIFKLRMSRIENALRNRKEYQNV